MTKIPFLHTSSPGWAIGSTGRFPGELDTKKKTVWLDADYDLPKIIKIQLSSDQDAQILKNQATP